MLTYIVGWDEHGWWIQCSICGLISYNENDVRERYCGHCHIFHDPIGGAPRRDSEIIRE